MSLPVALLLMIAAIGQMLASAFFFAILRDHRRELAALRARLAEAPDG